MALRARKHEAIRVGASKPKRLDVSIPVTPSFEPNAGTVTTRTKVTPQRPVLYDPVPIGGQSLW